LQLGVAAALISALFPAAPSHATFPGGDGRLVFYSDRGGAGSDIWISELDGSGAVNLTNTPGVDDFNPAWSPGGQRIVFDAAGPDSTTDVWVMAADGSGLVNVTNSPGASEGFAQFCGENSLVFHSDAAANFEIFLLPNLNRFQPIQLTDSPANDFVPTCSPDGSRIAWRNDAVGSEIWQMNRNGTGKVNLTNNPAGDSEPDYSPDGTELLFTSTRDGNAEVFGMDLVAVGNPVEQLTFTNGVTNETPAFFPGGVGFVHNSFNPVTGQRQLFVNGVAVGSGGGPKVQPRVTCEVVEVSEGVFELRITGTTGPDDIFLRRVPGHEEERLFEVVLDSKDVLCVVTIDVVEGGSIVGQLSRVRIDAGEGNDHVTVSLEVLSTPGEGVPSLTFEVNGGGDDDRLEFGTLDEIFEGTDPSEGFIGRWLGNDGGDTIIGGGLLQIEGGPGPDTIGLVGDDGVIDGGGGPDTVLSAGDGTTIDAGGAADTVKVGDGSQEVNGGGGNDDIEKVEEILAEIEFVFVPARPTPRAPTAAGPAPSAPGSSVFNGGSGNDRFDTDDGTRDTVIGGSGRDTATVDRRDVVRGVERLR
jgi:TolB protein